MSGPPSPAPPLPPPPRVTCKSWSVCDASGDVLLEAGSLAPCRIASITKVMTAHVVLKLAESQPTLLEELVLVSPEAAALAGTSAELRAGEVFTVLDLLYGMMLPSGNDAAVALAEYVGDTFAMPDAETGAAAGRRDHPTTRFVAEMQRECSRLGLSATRFGNVHGMGDTRGWSNARDVARLVAAALRAHPILRDIARARTYSCTVRAVPEKLIRVRKWDTYAGEIPPLPDRRGYPAAVVWTNLNVLLGRALNAEVEAATPHPPPGARGRGGHGSAAPPNRPSRPGRSPGGAAAAVDLSEAVADADAALALSPSRGAPAVLGPSARPQQASASAQALGSPGGSSSSDADAKGGGRGPPDGSGSGGSSGLLLRRRVTYVYDGVKTGRTPAAGACLCSSLRLVSVSHSAAAAAAASHGGHAAAVHLGGDSSPPLLPPPRPLQHLIITVLGSASDASRFKDTEALAAFAVRLLHLTDLRSAAPALAPEAAARLLPAPPPANAASSAGAAAGEAARGEG